MLRLDNVNQHQTLVTEKGKQLAQLKATHQYRQSVDCTTLKQVRRDISIHLEACLCPSSDFKPNIDSLPGSV